MKALVMALVLMLGCANSAALQVCDGAKLNLTLLPRDYINVQLYKEVNTEQELRNALASGITGVWLASPITLTKTLWLDSIIPKETNQVAIHGYGGFNGSQIWGTIAAKHDRDWEIRLKGVAFMGDKSSLLFDYVQHTILEDVIFINHKEPPFIFSDGSAVTFRDVQIRENRQKAILNGVTNIRWYGGMIEDHEPGVDRVRLHIKGPRRDRSNSYPGTVMIQDVRRELADILIEGMDDVTIFGGYHLASNIFCFDCGGRFHVSGGSWPNSMVVRDNFKVWPAACVG